MQGRKLNLAVKWNITGLLSRTAGKYYVELCLLFIKHIQ